MSGYSFAAFASLAFLVGQCGAEKPKIDDGGVVLTSGADVPAWRVHTALTGLAQTRENASYWPVGCPDWHEVEERDQTFIALNGHPEIGAPREERSPIQNMMDAGASAAALGDEEAARCMSEYTAPIDLVSALEYGHYWRLAADDPENRAAALAFVAATEQRLEETGLPENQDAIVQMRDYAEKRAADVAEQLAIEEVAGPLPQDEPSAR